RGDGRIPRPGRRGVPLHPGDRPHLVHPPGAPPARGASLRPVRRGDGGVAMKLVFLTTDDPLYLPAFYERVLRERAADTRAVYVVPPLYRRQNALQAGWRSGGAFGGSGAASRAAGIAAAGARRQSVGAACRRHGVRCEAVGDVNAPEFLTQLRALGPDLAISVSCPQIFKRPLIQLPPQ